mmetsp:Transcript_10497/g.11549  ORF Transcript_10497/g.11549 Transcript_10497/m.11549 type:complete len:180 (+) Transcript_10497:2-541(+)
MFINYLSWVFMAILFFVEFGYYGLVVGTNLQARDVAFSIYAVFFSLFIIVSGSIFLYMGFRTRKMLRVNKETFKSFRYKIFLLIVSAGIMNIVSLLLALVMAVLLLLVYPEDTKEHVIVEVVFQALQRLLHAATIVLIVGTMKPVSLSSSKAVVKSVSAPKLTTIEASTKVQETRHHVL